MSELHVIAILHPEQGKVARVEELLRAMCQQVYETELGVTRYLMTTEVIKDNTRIVMFETYKTQEENAKHVQTPHFESLFKKFEDERLLRQEATIIRTKSTGGYDLGRQMLQ